MPPHDDKIASLVKACKAESREDVLAAIKTGLRERPDRLAMVEKVRQCFPPTEGIAR